MTLNILSIESLFGSVQLNIANCLFSLDGISFLPPPTKININVSLA